MNGIQNCGCGCSVSPKAIFSCSGAADVGELSDRVARRLTREGNGKMLCLAAISGEVSGIIRSTEAAPRIMAIDGCGLACARKTLAIGGFTDIVHLNLADLGFQKGQTYLDNGSVERIVAHVATIF